jgi:hypothetical protein
MGWATNLYIDWIWFKSLNYQQVFITILLSELGLRTGVGVVIGILLFLNLLFTRRALINAAKNTPRTGESIFLSKAL